MQEKSTDCWPHVTSADVALEDEEELGVGGPARGTEEEGTRLFPRYDIGLPMFVAFVRHLEGIDGGQRSAKTAKEIAVDVSKYLCYACGPDCLTPDWRRLTDRDQLLGYTEKLKRAKVGPEGLLAKLDALLAALKYVKVHIIEDTNDPVYGKVLRMEDVIGGWKATLRKSKRKLRKSRLQQLSSELLSLDEVSALLKCDRVWADFHSTCSEVKSRVPVPSASLDQATTVLAGSLLYKNWQRPGAIVNATRDEFSTAKVCREGKETFFVMGVVNHKTAMEGVAKVTLDPIDQARVCLYQETVRDVQDVTGDSPLLFLLTGSRAVSNLSSRVKRVGERYGLVLPSASRVRKIGATCVATALGDSAKAHLVTRHMSHSASTEAQYYQAIVGDQHAVSAYGIMTALREGGGGGADAKSTADQDQAGKSEVISKTASTPVQKRRTYTAEETKAVQDYFSHHISHGETASLRECAQFLLEHPLHRSEKNIQDKVKSLSKAPTP